MFPPLGLFGLPTPILRKQSGLSPPSPPPTSAKRQKDCSRERFYALFHESKKIICPAHAAHDGHMIGLTPSTACGGPPPSRREVWGLRRSRPTALPSIAYRGFAVAPKTLRAPSRRFLYNPGCRVETLLVSKGVMGFLGDLREDRSRARPVGGSARRSIPSEREQPCCDL